jgi:hypothetical protein
MTNLPNILYRTFSSEKYAKEFINKVRFRLGLIEQYVKIEDKKRLDQTEGKSCSYVKSTIPHVGKKIQRNIETSPTKRRRSSGSDYHH